MSKAPGPAEDLVQRIVRQTQRSVRSAWPPYTPNVATVAPNLVIEPVSRALAALSGATEWRTERDQLTQNFAKEFRGLGYLSTPPEPDEAAEIEEFITLLRRSTTERPWKASRTIATLRGRLQTIRGILERLDRTNPQRHDVARESPEAERQRADRNSSILRDARSAYTGVESLLEAPATAAFERGHLLLVGEWGTGKTHSVCDVSLTRTQHGLPTLLLLAKDFSGRRPLHDAIQSLTQARLATLMSGLNALGRQNGTRALIIVDGINEGNRDGWSKACKTLIRAASRFQWVAVALTCRSPFEQLMFSGDELQELPSVTHPGFEGEEFDAQKSFFDFYELPLPEVPLLADEFSRPLTLKLICEAFKDLRRETQKKGISGIASGQKSMTFVFERFVDTASGDIQHRLNLPGKFCWRLLKDADGLCALMVREQREWATREELQQILLARLPAWTTAERRDLVTQMLAAGVLLEDRQWTGAGWHPVIRLPYQRFSDHLVARHLLDRHLPSRLTRRTIGAAFQADAPLGRLFAAEDSDPRRGGWREALIVEFPERLKRLDRRVGRELYDFLPKDTRKLASYFEPFVRGLPWRTVSSFSKTTDALLVSLLNGHAGGDASLRTLEAVLSLAIRPDHPWAARRIWKALMAMSLVERDLYWTEFLRLRDRSGSIERTLSWTERADTIDLSREVAAEMARIFSLVLSSTDVPLRDRATRALVKLGESQPGVLANQIAASLNTNDSYITERLLAAFYGVAMSKWSVPTAKAVHRQMGRLARLLMKESADAAGRLRTPHALIRDNLEGIVELASHRSPTVRANLAGWRLASERQTVDPFVGLNYARRRLEDAKGAIHMDFENYSLGSLVKNRSNYDMKHRGYQRVRRQVLARVADLGWTQELFKNVDRTIGARSLSRSTEPDRVERYGKKYSWIAYHEMYGLRSRRRVLPDWREQRPADCGPDPSFPLPPREWQLPLQHAFADAGKPELEWLASGDVPDYAQLLRVDTVDQLVGPWVLLDGYVNHRANDRREIFAFLRGLLGPARTLARVSGEFLQVDYPGNHKFPDSGEDHYTYAGEVPWSRKFGAHLRDRTGAPRRQLRSVFNGWRQTGTQTISIAGREPFLSPVGRTVPGPRIEFPAYESGWESYHSVTTPGYGAIWPAPAVCDALELKARDRKFDLHDSSGAIASLFRASRGNRDTSFKLVYLREDLLQRYLTITKQRLAWAVWGERQFHHEHRPRGVEQIHGTYQHIHRRWHEYGG